MEIVMTSTLTRTFIAACVTATGLIAATTATAQTTAPAQAQTPTPAPAPAQRAPDTQEVEKRFAAADKDGDGKLTLDEAKAGMPRVASSFDKIDKDTKGYITLDQLKVAVGASGK
jgi:hypothetical protein